MRNSIKKSLIIIGLTIAFSLFLYSSLFSECKECIEVAKGNIPAKFLYPSLKELPSGIAIWDLEEAIQALKDEKGKYLWVDTRPGSFVKAGTVKNATHLVCDLKGTPIPEDQHGPAFSQERLEAAIKQVDGDLNAVRVLFFCQGPECHRSYNAALRSVSEFGMDPSQIVWFRAGYPNLEKHILDNPKLKRKIAHYLHGAILN
ncbi:MAG: hypothetical protein ACMUIP_03155 [bacterium]